MADYSLVRAKSGDIDGVWLRDPAVVNEPMALTFLLIKEGLPQHVQAMVAAGSYRVVPNTYNNNGGCFVMWGATLVPGEKAPSNREQATAKPDKKWWQFWK